MEIAEILQRASGISLTMSADEFAKYRIESLNAEEGMLRGFDCPICRNKGYVWFEMDGEQRTRECECMTKRRNAKMLKRSGLEDAVKRYTFDTWQTPQAWQAVAKEMAEKYANTRKGWFVTCGRSGSGKTHLCTAICAKLLADGISTRYMLWRDTSVAAKSVVNDDAAYAAIVEPLKRVKALYIDDLFKCGKNKEPTEADVSLAFEILNSRYNDSAKLTIISTERSMEELLDIDEAVGSRIYERSKGYRLDFSDKPNWRLQ